MKRALLVPGIVASGLCCATTENSLSVEHSAQRLASCTLALDAKCVIGLSDIDIYNRLGAGNSGFEDAQVRFFESLKRTGRNYVRFDIGSPWPEFSKQGVTYAFVPYVSRLDGLPELDAYLVAISRDAGKSWKFVNGCHVSAENIQTVVPGYAGEPRPAADRC